MSDLGLARAGRDVSHAGLVRGSMPNVQAVTRLLQRQINSQLGVGSGSRGTLTADQTESAMTALDEIGDQVRDIIRTALDGEK